MHWAVAIVALTLLAFAAISGRIAGTPITAAMIFTAAGLLVGSEALGLIDVSPAGETVKLLAEATLALVLFADASRIDVRALRGELSVPLRLLGIGLPLTLVAGFVVALVVFPQLAWPEALLLAVILAPTDAALGQAVVTLTRLPSRVRQGLNVESGLNDGICVPLFWIVLAIAQAESGSDRRRSRGPAGARADRLRHPGRGDRGRCRRVRRRHRWWAPAHRWLLAPGRAAGRRRPRLRDCRSDRRLWLHRRVRREVSCSAPSGDGAEARSSISSRRSERCCNAVTFIVFGAVLLGPALGDVTWSIALYAVLSLTVVRMIPVAIAMIGTGARRPTVAFLGWFGPRGLASIVFAILVLEEGGLPARRPDAHHDLRDDRAVGPRSRSHGGASGQPLRLLARVASPGARRPAFEGSEVQDVRWRRGLGHPPAPDPAGG